MPLLKSGNAFEEVKSSTARSPLSAQGDTLMQNKRSFHIVRKTVTQRKSVDVSGEEGEKCNS